MACEMRSWSRLHSRATVTSDCPTLRTAIRRGGLNHRRHLVVARRNAGRELCADKCRNRRQRQAGQRQDSGRRRGGLHGRPDPRPAPPATRWRKTAPSARENKRLPQSFARAALTPRGGLPTSPAPADRERNDRQSQEQNRFAGVHLGISRGEPSWRATPAAKAGKPRRPNYNRGVGGVPAANVKADASTTALEPFRQFRYPPWPIGSGAIALARRVAYQSVVTRPGRGPCRASSCSSSCWPARSPAASGSSAISRCTASTR